MSRLLPSLTATRLQASAYLLGVALFSISFLVFLNSIIAFVVTDVIGQRDGTGDIVGTLGFADELLALVACPLWGLLSDRVGVRTVAVAGYCIIGVSLICLVQSTNVYPELLMGRLGFSLGGAACSTMVTAALPAMVMSKDHNREEADPSVQSEPTTRHSASSQLADAPSSDVTTPNHAPTPSVSSELTITQNRYRSRTNTENESGKTIEEYAEASDVSQLAGLVGLFTGAGALLALLVFLPLPAHLQKQGQEEAQSVRTSFYIVGGIAFCVAIFVSIGLRGLPNEDGKRISALWRRPYEEDTKTDADGHLHTELIPAPSYLALARDALVLGFTDHSIGLGYLGGFVARASSVAISLFIPLFVKLYFIKQGYCDGDPNDPTDTKAHCRQAYTLAAALSGIAETAALVCAPLFGWLGGKLLQGRAEWPLLGASVLGIGGYVAFGFLRNPDPFHGDGGRWALLAVIMIGMNQIGAIVCSLALLGRGIQHVSIDHDIDDEPTSRDVSTASAASDGMADGPDSDESAPLMDPGRTLKDRGQKRQALARSNRLHLKGSIAGMYSFVGGAGILVLNKAGGALFDSWRPGAPFFMLAIFNGVLFVAVAVVGSFKLYQKKRGIVA